MMWSNNIYSFAGLHLHMIFVAVAILGAILFVYWATKNLDKKRLGILVIWLLVVGIVGMLLTASMGPEAMFKGMASMQEEDHDSSMIEEMGEHMNF